MTLCVMSVVDKVPEIARAPSTVLVQIRIHVAMTLSLMSVAVEVHEIVPVPAVFLVPLLDTVLAG